jgi:hypothetical protein
MNGVIVGGHDLWIDDVCAMHAEMGQARDRTNRADADTSGRRYYTQSPFSSQ